MKFEVRAYSVKELSAFYCVCERTFRKWISVFKSEIGERVGRYYNIRQVMIILKKLGLPSSFDQDYIGTGYSKQLLYDNN